MKQILTALILAAACIGSITMATTRRSISIPVASTTKITQQAVTYRCHADTKTRKAEDALSRLVPGSTISVTYINADDIRLAIVPIGGKTQVFTNVIAADGAKYEAAQYVWWSKGQDVMLSDAMDENASITCSEQPHHP